MAAAADDASDDGDRQLLENEIDDMQDGSIAGSLQAQIDANAAAIANFSNQALANHTHTVKTAIPPGGINPALSSHQTTSVALGNLVGQTAHTHVPGDIPHTHTDTNASNHVHTTTTNQYQVTHNLAVYSSTPQGGTTSTTSGPQ